jgi:peptidoglycan biosynthesis protein MviN/MurJ (putative lipid II flippase)
MAFLYAAGPARRVVRITLIVKTLWVALGVPLLILDVGALAFAIAWSASAVLEAILLARETRRHMPVRVGRALVPGIVIAALVAAGSWPLAEAADGPVVAVGLGVAALAAYAAMVLVWNPGQVRPLMKRLIARRSVA